MLGILSFPVLALQDPSLFQTLYAVIAGFLFLLSEIVLYYDAVMSFTSRITFLIVFPGGIFSDLVVVGQLFSLKRRILLLHLLGCCQEHGLCMGIYSRLNVR
jgi:hypothetical protein